jgi:hypothetical protein
VSTASFRGDEQMAIIASKQELVLFAAIANHQHQMTGYRLHVQDFGRNPFPTLNNEKFAVAVPANIDSDLHPGRRVMLSDSQTRAYTGEVPTQRHLGRHATP